jgi:hypothetical protein
MKEELIWALVFDYPRVFIGARRKYMTASFQGISCGDGWEPVIRWLSAGIERLIEQEPEDEREIYRCIEIRERFGGLEFYMNDATTEMAKLVRVAVSESFTLCEFCGNPGSLRQDGKRGAKTLCDACRGKVVVLPLTVQTPPQMV